MQGESFDTKGADHSPTVPFLLGTLSVGMCRCFQSVAQPTDADVGHNPGGGDGAGGCKKDVDD